MYYHMVFHMSKKAVEWSLISKEELEAYKDYGYKPQRVPCSCIAKMGFRNFALIKEGDVLRICHEHGPSRKDYEKRCVLVEVVGSCPKNLRPTWVYPEPPY